MIIAAVSYIASGVVGWCVLFSSGKPQLGHISLGNFTNSDLEGFMVFIHASGRFCVTYKVAKPVLISHINSEPEMVWKMVTFLFVRARKKTKLWSTNNYNPSFEIAKPRYSGNFLANQIISG